MKGRAKMNDAAKIKEPETAATESGSEQEIVPNIPADIVTPSEENVKYITESERNVKYGR